MIHIYIYISDMIIMILYSSLDHSLPNLCAFGALTKAGSRFRVMFPERCTAKAVKTHRHPRLRTMPWRTVTGPGAWQLSFEAMVMDQNLWKYHILEEMNIQLPAILIYFGVGFRGFRTLAHLALWSSNYFGGSLFPTWGRWTSIAIS